MVSSVSPAMAGVKVKIDLQEKIAGGQPVIIELGCGLNKRAGRIGIDKLDLPGVDIVADLDDGLSFLPDSSVDEVHSHSLLEHVNHLDSLIREISRVLKPNGKCYTFVPHFSNPYYYSDYTHTRFFGLYTFYYFVDFPHQLKRKVPNHYTDIRIRVVSQKLIFMSPFRSRNIVKRVFGRLFNMNSFMQEFYEENLCGIIPAYGLYTIFTPEKQPPSVASNLPIPKE